MSTDIEAPRPPAPEKCWTCRRRRLKCDGTIPACRKCITNGLECPGYGKQLKWMSGVASRGYMKDTAYKSDPAPPRLRKKRQGLVVLEYEPSPKCRSSASSACTSSSPLSITSSPPTQLTDPIFQDMGYNARYLLTYFDRKVCTVMTICDEARTPYRELMPLVGSSEGVANAMMAVAALHAMHASIGSPIMLSHAVQANSIHVNEKQLDVLQSQLLHHCITFKQKALEFLSVALQDPHQHNELQTFGTAVVLVLLECFETGAGSWAIHLDGAKKLLEAGIQKSSTLEAFVEELMLFEIFGSTFVPPNVVSTSITTRTFSATSPETILFCNSFVCPVELLQPITSATAKSRIARQAMLNLSNAAECTSAIEDLKSDLIKIQQFHSLAWVEKVIQVTGYLATVSRQIIAQMCLIWKLSAAIYVSRLLYTLTGDAQYLSPIVDDLITAFIPIQNKVQLKFLLWPAVIAGISTTRPDHRAWILSTLDEIWRLTLCANAKGAAMVLKKLWEMKDARIHEIGDDHGQGWDWLCDMSTLDGYWLLF